MAEIVATLVDARQRDSADLIAGLTTVTVQNDCAADTPAAIAAPTRASDSGA